MRWKVGTRLVLRQWARIPDCSAAQWPGGGTSRLRTVGGGPLEVVWPQPWPGDRAGVPRQRLRRDPEAGSGLPGGPVLLADREAGRGALPPRRPGRALPPAGPRLHGGLPADADGSGPAEAALGGGPPAETATDHPELPQ